MRFPCGALLNPLLQKILFRFRKRLVCGRRRHHDVDIVGNDALVEFTCLKVVGLNNGGVALNDAIRNIQPQVRFTRILIGTMTRKAAIGE